MSNAPVAGPEARGGQLLQPTMQDGVKVFELSTGVVRWSILPDVEVGASSPDRRCYQVRSPQRIPGA